MPDRWPPEGHRGSRRSAAPAAAAHPVSPASRLSGLRAVNDNCMEICIDPCPCVRKLASNGTCRPRRQAASAVTTTLAPEACSAARPPPVRILQTKRCRLHQCGCRHGSRRMPRAGSSDRSRQRRLAPRPSSANPFAHRANLIPQFPVGQAAHIAGLSLPNDGVLVCCGGFSACRSTQLSATLSRPPA